MSAQIWATIGSLFAAIVAALLSFLALQKTGRSKIAEFRRIWIEELRSDISEVLTYCLNNHADQTVEEKISLWEATFRIELRLNPLEDDHKELLRLIDILNTERVTVDLENREKVLKPYYGKIMDQSRKILRTEWKRLSQELTHWR